MDADQKKSKIAILGATSHIAKGLINNFLQGGGVVLHLYTRSPEKVRSFLEAIGGFSRRGCVIHKGYKDFMKVPHDVLINCVGTGTLNKLRGNYANWFTVTEEYDNLAIGYLRDNHPDATYVSFSSGAVYGRALPAPAEKNSANSLRVNHIDTEDYYAIARLNAEAKHRAFKNLRIVDLRIFSYFSRFIDLTDGYFITEILNCILKKKVLVTDKADFVRDYVHPEDLCSIVRKCIDAGKINKAFDVTSAKSVKKREILDYFKSEYGLKYRTGRSLRHASATGPKNIYCSSYNKAACVGYKPVFSSMDAIRQESKYILDASADGTRRGGIAD